MSRRGDSLKRILVVEDEPSVSRLCRQALASEGFNVDTAANGEVAKRMLRKEKSPHSH